MKKDMDFQGILYSGLADLACRMSRHGSGVWDSEIPGTKTIRFTGHELRMRIAG